MACRLRSPFLISFLAFASFGASSFGLWYLALFGAFL